MARIVNYKGLGYDDIGIVPSAPSKVSSRSEIPLEGYRIIVAGMTSIICEEFLKEWAQLPKELRCSIHIPRDKYSIEHLKLIANWKLQDWIWVGVGLKTPEIENIALELGYKNILIDIAHGGLKDLDKHYNRLKIKFGVDSKIVVGSIATQEQAHYLQQIGFDGVRSGIAGGNVCSTKYISGVHIKVASELMNLHEYLSGSDTFILADSGFKYPGDFAKAFLLGASYCMSGYIFTKCKNARMHIDGTNQYYGMSDKNLGCRAGQTEYSEALKKKIDNSNLKSLYDILMIVWGGVRSAVSYSGFSNLNEAIGEGEFCIFNTPLEPNLSVWD
jgi:hypothetical protein